MLCARISIFTSLPLASISRLALQERLDEIGKTTQWRLTASRRHRRPRPTSGLVQVEFSRLGSYIWL